MTTSIRKTGERMIPEDFESKQEYLIYLRLLFAYEYAKKKTSKRESVLEVGSGEGYGTSSLSKKVKKIVGIEVNKEAVNHASQKYGSEKCLFKYYDGISIPFADRSFDVVVSFQVVEHVQDDKNFLSEIYRVLKKGGELILTTPNRIYRLRHGQKPWDRFHIREYYPSGLEKILKRK